MLFLFLLFSLVQDLAGIPSVANLHNLVHNWIFSSNTNNSSSGGDRIVQQQSNNKQEKELDNSEDNNVHDQPDTMEALKQQTQNQQNNRQKQQSPNNGDITSNMIVFQADEKKHCFETNRATNVTVVGSTGNHDHGSSKVKLKNLVDYKWEMRNYPGRLIAVHNDGNIVAYTIKVNNKEGRNEGMVRVTNPNKNLRVLVKGMASEVLDLQFAHIKNQIILACVEEGALHINQIDPDTFNLTLLVKIVDNSMEPAAVVPVNRLSWCPYVPEKETEINKYVSQQLVWVRGQTFRCYSIRSVVKMYGTGKCLNASDVENTVQHKETSNVTEAAYSPDGTTLCVSCEDGIIRFYQIYFLGADNGPRRLHQWNPHGGKPISGFFFLDNLTKYSLDKSLWRHAITTSDNNTEIKVWCCSTWECLQTIRFTSSVPDTMLYFNAQMDRTASYLVLADAKNRGLYVLQVQLESSGSPPRNHNNQSDSNNAKRLASVTDSTKHTTDSVDSSTNGVSNDKSTALNPSTARSFAYIKSISEFPVSSPILSFGLVDAAVRKYKCAFNDSYLIEELDDYDEENNVLYCVVIHMFLVQPKSVQECHVLYQPTISEETDVQSSIGDPNDKTLLNSSVSGSSSSVNNEPPTPNPIVVAKHKILGAIDDTSLLVVDQPLIIDSLLKSPNVKKIDSSTANKLLPGKIQSNEVPPKATTAAINLMTPDSFQSPGRVTPEGVSSEVHSTLRMLAQASQSPGDIKRKSVETVNLLSNLAGTKINNDEPDPHQQALLRQSVEAKKQILTPNTGAALLATAVAAASGGSSPSREVQEILSLKESDLNEFYDESSDLSHDISVVDDEVDGDSNGSKSNMEEQYNFNNETSAKEKLANTSKISSISNKPDKQNEATSKINEWPKLPPLTVGGVSSCSAAMSNMQCSSFNNVNSVNSTTTVANHSITDISNKLDQVLEFIQTQSCQISELRRCVDFSDAQKCRTEEMARLEQLGKKIEFNVSKMNEEYFKRCEREHDKRLELFIAQRDRKSREFRDHILHSVSQLVSGQLSERINAILVTELQRHIMPAIVSSLDAIKAQMQIDLEQRLAASDKLLRDNIAKVCTNKATMDVFGSSIVQGVQTSLQNVFTESVKIALVPAYEKASQEMFKQIQETFINGTKSYSRVFENFSAQYEPLLEQFASINAQVPEKLKVTCESTLVAFNNQLTHDMQRELKSMQLHLQQTVRDNVKAELRKGFETQAATIEGHVLNAVRSQAPTPAPSIYDVQEQIKLLLAQGQINAAFHQALVANDLQLVEFTIEKADYASVFNPCPLQQTVLLSLIQQISADMSNHNEIKQRYLSDSIVNLNMRDPTTKEHAPKVMRELYQHCQKYITANPTSPQISNVRVLMMAVQSFGTSIFQ